MIESGGYGTYGNTITTTLTFDLLIIFMSFTMLLKAVLMREFVETYFTFKRLYWQMNILVLRQCRTGVERFRTYIASV